MPASAWFYPEWISHIKQCVVKLGENIGRLKVAKNVEEIILANHRLTY